MSIEIETSHVAIVVYRYSELHIPKKGRENSSGALKPWSSLTKRTCATITSSHMRLRY